jgi:hypothetical protein
MLSISLTKKKPFPLSLKGELVPPLRPILSLKGKQVILLILTLRLPQVTSLQLPTYRIVKYSSNRTHIRAFFPLSLKGKLIPPLRPNLSLKGKHVILLILNLRLPQVTSLQFGIFCLGTDDPTIYSPWF